MQYSKPYLFTKLPFQTKSVSRCLPLSRGYRRLAQVGSLSPGNIGTFPAFRILFPPAFRICKKK
jgi:hypothetical protein